MFFVIGVPAIIDFGLFFPGGKHGHGQGHKQWRSRGLSYKAGKNRDIGGDIGRDIGRNIYNGHWQGLPATSGG